MEILQRALARFIADRTIDGMAKEQPFLDHRSRLLDFLGLRRDHQPVANEGVAGGDEFGEHRDLAAGGVPSARLDQAHATTAHHGKPRMPAIMRYLDP